MKITIEVNDGRAEVSIQDKNVTGIDALEKYMRAVESLLGAYTKVIDNVDVTDSSKNAMNMHNNRLIRGYVDKYVSYEDNERTRKVLDMADTVTEALKKMFGEKGGK